MNQSRSRLTESLRRDSTSVRIANELYNSLATPLHEFIDILLESLVYSDNNMPLCILIDSVLEIKQLLSRTNIAKLSNIYHQIVSFLKDVDDLNCDCLKSSEVMIKQNFKFFKHFFHSFKLLDSLHNYISSNYNLNDSMFVESVKYFIKFNQKWYIDLLKQSISYKEFLLTKIKTFSDDISSIDDLNSNEIIKSDVFKNFLTERKQRLLSPSLIIEYKNILIYKNK